MDSNTLLQRLPPYQEQEEIINGNQDVDDIITEVVSAHKVFRSDYACIADLFYDKNTKKLCKKIFDFCKRNIEYEVETEKDQTTRSPAAILEIGHGDCKHYASFIGGILSALNMQGANIDWCYRFASYKIFEETPYHVFVVVNCDDEEIWVDPVLQYFNERLEPTYIIDKKPDKKMLRRLSGINDMYYTETDRWPGGMVTESRIGLVVSTVQDIDQLNFDGSGKFAGVWGVPYLGLSAYADYDNDHGTDWSQVADDINAKIASGPDPGHTVDGNFVKWIFDHYNRAWNFFYEGGVSPEFNGSAFLPANYPKPVITDDGRLTLSNSAPLEDFRDGNIQVLTAMLQDNINRYLDKPYPLTPRQVKEFSQRENSPDSGNFFDETRYATGIFSDIAAFAKKLGGAPLRNAFLGLVGINAFGMAKKLKNAIYNDDGSIDNDAAFKIKSRWEKFGGNWEKLLNTVNHGAPKAAVSGVGKNMVGVLPAVATAWVAVGAAVIAAIMPLVKEILKSKQARTGLDYFTDPATGLPYIDPVKDFDLGTSIMDDPIGWIKDHPLESAAIAFVAYKLISKK